MWYHDFGDFTMKIILASAYPRRKELFADVAKDFIIEVSNADETTPEGITADMLPCFLSELKAKDVAAKHPNDIVIGCDTVVIKDDRVLGKPKNTKDATEMMRFLSGSVHEVITGCYICCGDKSKGFSERTKVEFFELSDNEIEDYVTSLEPYDKAGGYGIQGKAKVFIKGIVGDYFNVVGLPVARLKRELDDFIRNL